MKPETVVCFKWAPRPGYRSTYAPETVNALKRMVQTHYQHDHRFVCITDDSAGIDADVEIVPLWQDFADIPSPHGGKNPSCYRRLKLYAPEMADVLGSRFVAIDLDTVLTADVMPLWDRPEDIVLYGDTNPKTHYNGSMVLMTAGSRAKVWETFDPRRSPRLAMDSGAFGSDQGWISYCLGGGEAKWTRADGVYSYRNHLAPKGGRLPADARLVNFHGSTDPWSPRVRGLSWIQQHYYGEAVAA